MTVISLLHDELLGVGTSIDEVDAAGETVEVNGVHADVAFHGADSLAHDVVDHDVAAVAEDDIELVNSGVGVDAHGSRLHSRFNFFDTVVAEQIVQVKDKALIVVVGTISICSRITTNKK